MDKIDFKKEYKDLFKPSAKKASIVEVPKLNYLMIDGKGSPIGEEYQQAMETIYPMAYTLKFMAKTSLQRDFVVNPLEGLWWAEDYAVSVMVIKMRDMAVYDYATRLHHRCDV